MISFCGQLCGNILSVEDQIWIPISSNGSQTAEYAVNSTQLCECHQKGKADDSDTIVQWESQTFVPCEMEVISVSMDNFNVSAESDARINQQLCICVASTDREMSDDKSDGKSIVCKLLSCNVEDHQ